MSRECHLNVCLDLAISHISLIPCLAANIILELINNKFELIMGLSSVNMRHSDQHTLAYDTPLCFLFTPH